MTEKASKHARELLLKEYQAVLSTHSKAVAGYPFGSVVPFCLDRLGRPLLLISRIAQHTHNLQQDPRCSLLVGEFSAADMQAGGRLTLLADAVCLTEQAAIDQAAARYFSYFPESADYQQTHDFDFWYLQPVRARYIGGFGKIYWVDQPLLENPFSQAAEQAMLEHMNTDHRPAIAHYLQLKGLPEDPLATLVGIDGEGFMIRSGARLYRVEFPSLCSTPTEVRMALVALAKA